MCIRDSVGAFCPDDAPLLGAVSVIGPTLAMGNRLVMIPSEPYPLAATDLIQVLETSDAPAGVVNIVTGSHAELAKPLGGHLNVDAVWSFSSTDLSGEIERASSGNIKRTWVNDRHGLDWHSDQGEGEEFLAAAVEVKTIWVPYGA